MGVGYGEVAQFPAGMYITGTTPSGQAIDFTGLSPAAPFMDKYANLIFSNATANSYWNIKDTNGNIVLKVYVDGTKNIHFSSMISIDGTDSNGNILDATAIGSSSPLLDKYGNIKYPHAGSGSTWSIVDNAGASVLKAYVDGTQAVHFAGDADHYGHLLSSGTPIIQCNYASVPTNGGGGYVWTFANSVPGGHNYQPSMTMNDVPGTQYFTSCGNNSTTKCTYYQSASGSMPCWMFLFIQRQ